MSKILARARAVKRKKAKTRKPKQLFKTVPV